VLYISTRQAYRYLRRVREREGDWEYESWRNNENGKCR
jgi:hypothetical protein